MIYPVFRDGPSLITSHLTMSDLKQITKLFVGYKLVLGSLLFVVPTQFDTSTRLLLPKVPFDAGIAWRLVAKLTERLVVWDSVFYVTIAQRGLVFEHEWAFGRGWPYLIEILTPSDLVSSPLDPIYIYGITSAVISVTSHYLTTLCLYLLTKKLNSVLSGKKVNPDLPRVVACLYVLCPAGMFLISGYAESTFALLSFVGLYFRAQKRYVFAGIAFAMASLVRSNGLAWGILFAFDLMYSVIKSQSLVTQLSIIIGGSILGAATATVQAYTYLLYCPGRPWCEWTVPSVFSYVQAKYWSVGWLQYWTPNNIPNFLMAMPTLLFIYKSSRAIGVRDPQLGPIIIIQALLGAAALLVYNVQIITRMSSCMPAIYWYCGQLLVSKNRSNVKLGRYMVTYFVVWTISQGILFAAFLPPA
uniref:GPI mannosyltransferase 2 n=1 Tax=Blastobotrys adeninivorans TaxID=409370 RepID=A0A060SZG5_BLAAD